MARLLFVSLICISINLSADAQKSVRTHLSFEYGMQLPSADFKDRFGTTLSLGFQYEALFTESLWHGGIKGMFFFGNQVKEDVLSNLRTPEGNVIGKDRNPADVSLKERGIFAGLYVGKIFPFSEKNPHSGLKISLGGGVMQHKIRVQDNSSTIVQITGKYKSGYDRLSNGPAMYGFIGYQNLAPNKRFNFFAGFDYLIAFTKNRRAYNFNEQRQDDTSRTDSLFGFRIGWILPITYGVSPNKIYY